MFHSVPILCGSRLHGGHGGRAADGVFHGGWVRAPYSVKATGIPSSMLIDCEPNDPDAMMKMNGQFVKYKPEFQKKSTGNATATAVAAPKRRRSVAVPQRLLCALDKRILVDAVRASCCNARFSDENISEKLMETDFVCPICGEELLLDDLEPDKEIRKSVLQFRREKAGMVLEDMVRLWKFARKHHPLSQLTRIE